ncbi:hypothetical protein H0Z60_01785 [Ectothiorhodospiraceae bacterium WFHF3C12]|nr:hypothetical protein [Ectothiorhodospiraceae bacterium WFHF3C12]
MPGAILLVIGALPFLFLVSEPSRFLAGQPSADERTEPAALAAELERLRDRVRTLEAQLAGVRGNPVMGLGEHMRLVSTGDGEMLLRFSGLDVKVVNQTGVVLDTSRRQ